MRPRLGVLVVHAGVADVRGRHDDDLAVVRGVGEGLLVAGHAGGEHRFAEGLPHGPVGAAAEDAAVLQDEYGGSSWGLPWWRSSSCGAFRRRSWFVSIMCVDGVSTHSACSAAWSERKPESSSLPPCSQVTISRPPSVRTLPAMPLSSRASRSWRPGRRSRAPGAYDVQARVGERQLDAAAGAQAVRHDAVEPLPRRGGAVVAAAQLKSRRTRLGPARPGSSGRSPWSVPRHFQPSRISQ